MLLLLRTKFQNHVSMVRASSDCGACLMLQSVMQQAHSVSICFAPCEDQMLEPADPGRAVNPWGATRR